MHTRLRSVPLWLISISLLLHAVYGANILGICPFPAVSHQISFQNIMSLLVDNGHNVTLIAPMSLKDERENYTFIDISHTIHFFRKKFNFNAQGSHPLESITNVVEVSGEVCEQGLNSTILNNFLRQHHHFDLVFIQTFVHFCYFGIVHHLGSPPVIAYSSLGGFSTLLEEMGNEVNAAISPDFLVSFTNRMTFWERMYNWVHIQRMRHLWTHSLYPKHNDVIRRWFGQDTPDVADMYKNVSAMFVNSYWGIEYPRQYYPNVVELSGVHVQEDPGTLPEDVKEFLDKAEEGVVYMSMGSNIKSSSLPEATIRAIIKSFSSLRQKVVWKWESQRLDAMPNNVLVRNWMPQQAILAHPNVRVFVMQGGLQSFQEAVYHGVPVLIIPFMSDQPHNAQKAESSGIGKHLPPEKLNSQTFSAALQQMLNDSTYQSRMRLHSSMLRAHRRKSLNDILWWTDFLVKHGSPPELRPVSLDLKWYQIYMVDVFGMMLFGVLSLLFLAYKSVKLLTRRRSHKTQKLH